MRSWIVANKEELANMDERYANYSYKIDCADGNSLWMVGCTDLLIRL